MFRASDHYSDSAYASEPEPLRVRTLDEVGHELGLSRERVRQIEAIALRKVRLCERIKELAPPGQAWPLIDGLRGCELEQFREVVRRLKHEHREKESAGRPLPCALCDSRDAGLELNQGRKDRVLGRNAVVKRHPDGST
jgi:hypothetical protein